MLLPYNLESPSSYTIPELVSPYQHILLVLLFSLINMSNGKEYNILGQFLSVMHIHLINSISTGSSTNFNWIRLECYLLRRYNTYFSEIQYLYV